jgi:glycosyltransferase involved in cell wall biosynthesis
MRKNRYDVIHLHSSKAGLVGRIASALVRPWRSAHTVIYTPHALAFQAGGARGVVYLAAEKALAPLTDLFAAVSEGERNLILRKRLATDAGTILTPNGVDPSLYDIPPACGDPVTVGMAARLVEQKGVPYFLDAARIVRATLPRTRFILIGDGPGRRSVEEWIQRTGVPVEASFGFGSIADFLSRTAIVVFPSLWEGLPYTLLEAMAARRGIVASDIPGISDVVADCGMLVAPRNSNALADAIAGMIRNPDERIRLGKAARLRVEEHFSIEAFSERIVALYRRASGL